MITPFACPSCGGTLFIDQTAEIEIPIVPHGIAIRDRPLGLRRVTVPVAFCGACEFSVEIRVERGERP